MAFKIYTKTGDKGTTSLIGGVRVPKNHIRIESYGTVDELNSYLGMVTDLAQNEQINSWLREIQDRLFTVGSVLATNPDKEVKMKLPDVHDADVLWLEKRTYRPDERSAARNALLYFTRWQSSQFYLSCGAMRMPPGRTTMCRYAAARGIRT